MKYRSLSLLLFVFLFNQFLTKASERKELFDSGWHFNLGKNPTANSSNFDDSKWRIVDLPHDWSVEPLANQKPGQTIGPFSKESPGGAATGQTMGGEGWYRKSFIIKKEDANKKHELYFEGVYNQAEIWVNGKAVYFNAYGYTTFRFDISKYCNPAGQKNSIAVKVLNEGKNSRWYTGSGIYRHVWIIRTSKSHIDDWGTFIKTKSITNNIANITVDTKVINSERNTSTYVAKVEVITKQGRIIADAIKTLSIKPNDTVVVPLNLVINNPTLWSTENPNLYRIKIKLSNGDQKLDEVSIPFGVRTISFTTNKGFELNGKMMKLKGGCVHHDNGLLGAAAFDQAEYRKIALLKQNGYNAIRVSHNPMSESFMNACDELGMLVINEAFDQWKASKNPQDYHLYFDKWSARDIKSLVLRDRNHPSVIMWSIGNEIRERISEKGLEIAGYLKKEILKYDNTRPVTAGVNKYWDKERKNMLPLDNAFFHLDVAGYNYMWRFYEEEHAKFPNRIMFGSESVATEAAQNWDMVEKHNYVIGDFVWTAMDYLGESGIGNVIEVDPKENVHQFMDWPWFNGWCGDLDILGIKKPQSYYRDVIWRNAKISMAVELPVPEGKIRKVSFWGWPEEVLSWTFPGSENKKMKVNVYSRAAKVRLYLNDVLIAEKETDQLYKAVFQVPYQAGTLKAVAVNDGKEEATTLLKTIGKASALKVTADKKTLAANGQDLSFILIELVDNNGNVVNETGRKVNLSITGIGSKIIASGSASPNDMESFGSLTPKLFNGRAMVILRSGYKNGIVRLKIKTNELNDAGISITTKQK